MKKMIGIIIVVFLITIIGIKIFVPEKSKIKVVGDGNIKIACLGDSITHGFKVSNDDIWTALLPKMNSNYQTINYGLVSRTLLSTGDYPYFSEDTINEFWKNKEDIIIIMLGTNDTKDINWNYNRFEKEYRELINKLLKNKPNEKIYLMIPPQLFIDDIGEDRPNRKNLENGVIPIINKLSKEYDNIEVIDLYRITKDHSELFIDGIHPSEEGHRIIAAEILKVIEREK